MRIPNSFKAKDCPTSENLFICRWLNPNDWDSVMVLYKKVSVKKFFGLLNRDEYTAVALEYVPSHWGIEYSCCGDSAFKSKMKADLEKKGIKYDFLKLKASNALDRILYDMETHKVTQVVGYDYENVNIFNYWTNDLK